MTLANRLLTLKLTKPAPPYKVKNLVGIRLNSQGRKSNKSQVTPLIPLAMPIHEIILTISNRWFLTAIISPMATTICHLPTVANNTVMRKVGIVQATFINHQPPSVQHFIGWIAACGFLCSDNPADAYTGIDSGWGWVHELGHNTVQNVLNLTFKSSETGKTIGCAVECDNNHLAGLSMLRKYALYGSDNNTDNFAHWLIYEQINNTRATNTTDEALRKVVEKNIWNGDGYANNNGKRAFAMQQAFTYTRLVLNETQPSVNGTFEYFRLLNIGSRLVGKMDIAKATAEEKAKYGLGAYTDRSYTNPELNYMLTSKIIGYDMKNVYQMYGLPISDKARQSVAMLNLPTAPLNFYAIPRNRANHLSESNGWITYLLQVLCLSILFNPV